ncbi:hypothetical protein AC622_01865 [Bacillus sp. FJAT-27916]|uniref:hypothetical protein n=1 Tax=Bacillus sp. FJAT-27916 TaxID=1679169 RepID=UPI000670F251|nr:hypothetical protein [Bacillus sp. FJAT-27916]KMY43155.1 hypothetical protein AC622_01865 [Bacillus sp. FJAT-27916]
MDLNFDYKSRLFDCLYEMKKYDAELYVKYADRVELELYRLEQIDRLSGALKTLKGKEQEARFRRLWNDMRSEQAEKDGI